MRLTVYLDKAPFIKNEPTTDRTKSPKIINTMSFKLNKLEDQEAHLKYCRKEYGIKKYDGKKPASRWKKGQEMFEIAW